MNNLKALKKKIDLINSEGSILSVHLDPKGNLIIKALISFSYEEVYFKVNLQDLKMYVSSFINLNDLYESRDSFFLITKKEHDIKTYISKNFECELFYGNLFYDEISESLKPTVGLEEFTLKIK